MNAWIDAFLPTFGLIGLGLVLRRTMLREDALWAGLERLVFWILLPALLAYSISTVPLAGLPLGRLAIILWTSLVVATAASLILARALGHRGGAMTSVVQGGIRFNTYTSLAICGGIYGQEGIALAGVVAGLIVPAAQLILAIVFVAGDERRLSPVRMLVQAASNPLLLGCLVGFAFAALGGMPPGLLPFARSLGQASLALGLLCVGAGLTIAALREGTGTQAAVAAEKLVFVPAVTLAFAAMLGLDRLSSAIAVLVMAMPTATSSYVMARALGGDARLMAAIITLQHVAAVITLPLWAEALR